MKIASYGLTVVLCFLMSCKGSSDSDVITEEGLEFAQQVGDFMTSIDEFGGNDRIITSLDRMDAERDFRRYSPRDIEPSLISQLLLPEVWAATCSSQTYNGCGSGAQTKNFAGCTVGSLTINGTVTLQWNPNTACAMSAPSHYVTRKPTLTSTGRLGATLSITAANEGQRITYLAAGQFAISSDGINRKFTSSGGSVLMDFTSRTSANIMLTGTTRQDRVLNGGTLVVVNNRNSAACSYTPSNVAWTNSSCSCPVSGVWSGSCTDGNSSSIQMTGCGTANVQFNGVTSSIKFDRCGG